MSGAEGRLEMNSTPLFASLCVFSIWEQSHGRPQSCRGSGQVGSQYATFPTLLRKFQACWCLWRQLSPGKHMRLGAEDAECVGSCDQHTNMGNHQSRCSLLPGLLFPKLLRLVFAMGEKKSSISKTDNNNEIQLSIRLRKNPETGVQYPALLQKPLFPEGIGFHVD